MVQVPWEYGCQFRMLRARNEWPEPVGQSPPAIASLHVPALLCQTEILSLPSSQQSEKC